MSATARWAFERKVHMVIVIALAVAAVALAALYAWARDADDKAEGERNKARERAEARKTYERRVVRHGDSFTEVVTKAAAHGPARMRVNDDEPDRSRIYRAPAVPLKPASLPPIGRQAVAGEYYRRSTIGLAVSGRESELRPVGDWGCTAKFDARLRLEPENEYDPLAIAVDINGYIVGYIPKDETGEWQPLLQDLARNDRIAACIASVYVDGDGYSIVLHCSPEQGLVANDEPDGKVLDGSSMASLMGEEDAQDVLGRYGAGSRVWADLRTGSIPKGKYKGRPTLWAYVDGTPVGYLTERSSERLYGGISQELPCHCVCAIVQGGKKLEASVMAPKTNG